jgi:hypothetical protein
VSFSASASASAALLPSSSELLFFAPLSFLLLSLLESYLQDVCIISIVCVCARACVFFFFPANFVDRVVLT